MLADFYEQIQRPEAAAGALTRCIEVDPARSQAYFALAEALEQLGRVPEIVDVYARLCVVRPDFAAAHFNRAVYLRRVDRLEEAVDAYRIAIDLGIDGAADAWSNLGVVLGELERHDEARDAFVQALAVDARWIPALYNLGLLHEEFGEREAALERFERVLAIDPEHHDAFVRVVHASLGQGDDDAMAERVRLRLQTADRTGRAGSVVVRARQRARCVRPLRRCVRRVRSGECDLARPCATVRSRGQRARTRAARNPVRRIVAVGGASRIGGPAGVRMRHVAQRHDAARAHARRPSRAYAGRGDFVLHPERGRRNDPIAQFGAVGADDTLLRSLGQGYVAMLERRFPGRRVINKRPDTWRYIGLLHGLFPEAKFIVVQRDPLDTCLSVYFQQLDALQLPYSTDLVDTAHHLRGCRDLVNHWKALLPNQIMEVRYEDLVGEPEATLQEVCGFLGISWDPRMLEFSTQHSRVRTASVWQVREPVHLRSVGRWRQYRTHLGATVEMLGLEDRREH